MNNTPLSQEDAYNLAKNALVAAYRDTLELQLAHLNKGDVYNFDPEEWIVFRVVNSNRAVVGATDHCAVNLSTGEFLDLGEIGE